MFRCQSGANIFLIILCRHSHPCGLVATLDGHTLSMHEMPARKEILQALLVELSHGHDRFDLKFEIILSYYILVFHDDMGSSSLG